MPSYMALAIALNVVAAVIFLTITFASNIILPLIMRRIVDAAFFGLLGFNTVAITIYLFQNRGH